MKTKIGEWAACVEQLDALKARELVLRAEIFGALFPSPEEGVNTSIVEGVTVKGTHKINRTLDPKAWERIQATVPAEVRVALVRYKPELVTSAWKALTPAQRLYLADAVNEKPGTPTLEVK